MTPRVADRKVALEIRAPDRVGRRILGQTVAIRDSAATTASPDEALLPQNVTDRARGGPNPDPLLTPEYREPLARAPPRMAGSRGEGVGMGRK
jgi:hypothetical protein